MPDLVSRLLEAIAETERLAQACLYAPHAGTWTSDSDTVWIVIPADDRWSDDLNHEDDVEVATTDDTMHRPFHFEWAKHIAHNDPSSVLRRCAADRKLVDLHGIIHRDIGWLEWDEGEHAEMYAELPVCGLCVPKHSSFPRREDVPEGPCRTVRILAEGYGLSDHQEGGDRG